MDMFLSIQFQLHQNYNLSEESKFMKVKFAGHI